MNIAPAKAEDVDLDEVLGPGVCKQSAVQRAPGYDEQDEHDERQRGENHLPGRPGGRRR
jgi:ribosomal protein L12E/L44/L45/RPP1/RPP2